MTPQEEQLLNSLVERVNQTQLQEKDSDAEALLNQGFGSNPDAHYILAQTVLVQNIALDQAKAQVAQLQQQLQQAQQQVQQARQPAHATSFLGNLLGHRDPAPPPPPAYAPPQQFQQQAPQQGYVPVPPTSPAPGYGSGYGPGYGGPGYPQPPFVQPGYAQAGFAGPGFVPMGQPSFLRGAMQTAAGVAAGALAFEGVESVLHGIGGHSEYGMGGFGSGMMGGGGGRPMEETVINNYYDQPGQEHGEHSGMEHGSADHIGQDPHSHEAADQLPDRNSDQGSAHLTDASYNTSGDDTSLSDQTDPGSQNTDEQVLDGNLTQDDDSGDGGSGFDDSGSYDDGGGFDNSGGSDDGSGGGF